MQKLGSLIRLNRSTSFILTIAFLCSIAAGMRLYDFELAFQHIFVNGLTADAEVAEPDEPLQLVPVAVAASPTPSADPTMEQAIQTAAIAAAATPTAPVEQGTPFASSTGATRASTTTLTATPTPYLVFNQARSEPDTLYANSTATPTALRATTPFVATAYSGQDRITLLLLGVDQRTSEPVDSARSDTMILLTLDPATHTAGMLSIPRDLYVDIPGAGMNKINVAHAIGGPALAKKTVANLLGVRINYYARVNFRGFVQVVDALGGITIDVDRPLRDEAYPLGDSDEVRRLYIPAGLQHMDGTEALMYARTRHQDNDLKRLQRQQAILYAVREQTLATNAYQRLPELMNLLGHTVETDIPLKDIPGLITLIRDVSQEDITARTIDTTMTYSQVTLTAGDILVPDITAVRAAVRVVFHISSAAH